MAQFNQLHAAPVMGGVFEDLKMPADIPHQMFLAAQNMSALSATAPTMRDIVTGFSNSYLAKDSAFRAKTLPILHILAATPAAVLNVAKLPGVETNKVFIAAQGLSVKSNGMANQAVTLEVDFLTDAARSSLTGLQLGEPTTARIWAGKGNLSLGGAGSHFLFAHPLNSSLTPAVAKTRR
jgi:hypothetical protein